jgi:2-oxo-3-hexenedioate decarboxylase
MIKHYSELLDLARAKARPIAPLSKTFGEYPIDQAYLIQAKGIENRLSQGETLVGYKMGLTSRAKMLQMGLSTPIFGVLTDTMALKGSTLDFQNRIHPKVEPELALRTSKELKKGASIDQVFEAIDCFFPALEVLDSRYEGFKYFNLSDVVADNSSSSTFYLGPEIEKKKLTLQDLSKITIKFSKNGELLETSLTSAVLEHPLNAVLELLNLLEITSGKSLAKGSLVLTGAVCAALTMSPGETYGAQYLLNDHTLSQLEINT